MPTIKTWMDMGWDVRACMRACQAQDARQRHGVSPAPAGETLLLHVCSMLLSAR